MLHNIFVGNFKEWRQTARNLLLQNINPENIQWLDKSDLQGTLFNTQESLAQLQQQSILSVPRAFIKLAENVACHRSGKQWALLYLALWRLTHGEPHLLKIATDPVMHRLQLMYQQVRRDAHKMKAFVRFKLYEEEGDQTHYIAFHKPDHKVVPLIASFFQRRFSVMQWTIFTPDESVHWDGKTLQYGAGISANTLEITDEQDELWKVYYRSTFNPARIKLKAMRREMPVRYWPTMPETTIIAEMLKEAPQRVAKMLKHQEGLGTSASNFLPDDLTLESLRNAANSCQACNLFQCAKQTVFGVGTEQAEIMLVGEQPGDNEDMSGMPFIGPAGEILNQALLAANIEREKLYLTNAVKHFKHVMRNNKRIHVSPNIHEINACKPWLTREIEVIKPKIIVCLGLIAARSLINPGFRIKDQRGKLLTFSENQKIIVTYHPSAVLRAVTNQQREEIYQYLVSDLKLTVSILSLQKI